LREASVVKYDSGNRLLDALPLEERNDLLGQLDVVTLKSGEVTHTPGESYDWVLFPVDAVLSVVTTLAQGETCEIGTVGNEGISGVEVAFGAPVLRTTMCQVPGRAARIRTPEFLEAIERNPGLDALVRSAEKARMFFVEQMVVCNTIHTLEKRFARWLLLMDDRANRDEYPITHDFLSIMLGVRRPTVTEAAMHMQDAGAIAYVRGRVRIVDRPLLESRSCECYAATTEVFDAAIGTWGRILPHRRSVRPGSTSQHGDANAASRRPGFGA
jgi:CRP-like cAMP-binding protein